VDETISQKELLSALKKVENGNHAEKVRLLVRLVRHLFAAIVEPAEKKLRTITGRIKKEEKEIKQHHGNVLESIYTAQDSRLQELKNVHYHASKLGADIQPLVDQLSERKRIFLDSVGSHKIDFEMEIDRYAEEVKNLTSKLNDLSVIGEIRKTRDIRNRYLNEANECLSSIGVNLQAMEDQLNERREFFSHNVEPSKVDCESENACDVDKSKNLAIKLDTTLSKVAVYEIGRRYGDRLNIIFTVTSIIIAIFITYNIVNENIDPLKGLLAYIPIVILYTLILFFYYKLGMDRQWRFLSNVISVYDDFVDTNAKLSIVSDLWEKDALSVYKSVYEELLEANAKLSVVFDLWEKDIEGSSRQAVANVNKQLNKELEQIRHRLRKDVDAVRRRISLFNEEASIGEAAWQDPAWKQWEPASSPCNALRLGVLSLGPQSDGKATQNRRAKPDLNFALPALVLFAPGRSVLVMASGAGKGRAFGVIQSMILRLLATVSPGKLKFTFIDPVGLGQNVAGFLSLGEVDEDLITSRAWTEPQHIEQKLQELTEHMENVIQKYLRTKYATIENYNREAGEVAESYRALVVMDFPANFSEAAARRLVSIAQNGPRCGVYTFVMADGGKPMPHGFDITDLERTSNFISWAEDCFIWDDEDFRHCRLELDDTPPANLTEKVIELVGEGAKEAMEVKVPYDRVLELANLGEGVWWKGTTEQGIDVPLGPTGATKIQHLNLGTGTAHHALIVGRTGSGKSNLQHVIITSLALTYRPDEIQLYLIDFKEGVEFKHYADAALPHARVIAIESDREFGLSVLKGLDAEFHARSDLFKKSRMSDIAEYRMKTGEIMPRLLLLVDEFQEFFTKDDTTSSEAGQILEHLTRQGRGAGIHVILATQSLAGIPLSQAVFSQIQVRIALQCNESDSRMILADDNPAARRLSRPGEAIYNAASGLFEGNNPFQVALFNDEDRSRYLEVVSRLTAAAEKPFDPPIVFEGHEPALLSVCRPLQELLAEPDWPPMDKGVDVWMGEPIAMLPPTSVRFRRQSGDNLLIVTREEEEGIGLITTCVVSLAIQCRPESIDISIVDLSNPDAPWADVPKDLAEILPHPIKIFGRRDVAGLLRELVGTIEERLGTGKIKGPEYYLVIFGLHRARDLREEDGGFGRGFGMDEEEAAASPSENFETLLRDGPAPLGCPRQPAFDAAQLGLDPGMAAAHGTQVLADRVDASAQPLEPGDGRTRRRLHGGVRRGHGSRAPHPDQKQAQAARR
jgi:hypothetical protein